MCENAHLLCRKFVVIMLSFVQFSCNTSFYPGMNPCTDINSSIEFHFDDESDCCRYPQVRKFAFTYVFTWVIY